MLFLQGRLHFFKTDGAGAAHDSGAPSVLAAYDSGESEPDARTLRFSGLRRPSCNVGPRCERWTKPSG